MKVLNKIEQKNRILVKKCHVCGTTNESFKEQMKCHKCNKSFLPSNYFNKVHATNSKDYQDLFCSSDELHEEDLVVGLNVLW